MIWDQSTSSEIDAVASPYRPVFLPIGSTEQHGPHLVTGYDTWFAERLAADLAVQFNGIVLPAIAFGMADHHLGFGGTITIQAATLKKLILDICASVEKQGFQNLVIVNGHGGNYSWIKELSSEWTGNLKIRHDAAEKLLFSTIQDWSAEHEASACGLHAGLFETSMALFTHGPKAVRVEALQSGAMPAGSTWTDKEVQNLFKQGLKGAAPNGVVGDPRGATAELGAKFYKGILDAWISLLKNHSQ
jgi:creatinine amidohydrolase